MLGTADWPIPVKQHLPQLLPPALYHWFVLVVDSLSKRAVPTSKHVQPKLFLPEGPSLVGDRLGFW